MDMTTTCLPETCGSYLSGSVGSIFRSSVQLLYTAQCLLNEKWPSDSSDNITDLIFDYIVVGAGSAGSVVASRLSEDKCRRVLLVEAGGDPPFEAQIPAVSIGNLYSDIDWKYKTEPDPLTFQGMPDKRCSIGAGKVLGGGSTLNGMNYVRGNRKDYDEMEAAGNYGWSYEESLKYFKKSENMSDETIKQNPHLSEYHSFDGPIGVTVYKGNTTIDALIIKGFTQVGYPYNVDYNGINQLGVTPAQFTYKDGKRSSTSKAYLVPARDRSNLVLWKHALASKILIDNNVATGVRILLKNGTKVDATIRKEVIISCGTIRTPHLLMLSGIGPRDHLEKLNIKLIKDLPVGLNLVDHFYVPLIITADAVVPARDELSALVDVAQYIAYQTGFFSHVGLPGNNIVSFINSDCDRKTCSRPSLQIYQIFMPKQSDSLSRYCSARFVKEICDSFATINNDSSVIMFYLVLLDEYSRGNVSLSSTDPTEYPKIYPNYLRDKRDIEKLLKGIGFINNLVKTPSLQSINAKIPRMNILKCNAYDFQSDDYWMCVIHHLGQSFVHLRGTSKMGPRTDVNAVVAPDLKVYGIDRLRVADASVIPGTISGNTNAATMMFAEHISDLIKASHSEDYCK